MSLFFTLESDWFSTLLSDRFPSPLKSKASSKSLSLTRTDQALSSPSTAVLQLSIVQWSTMTRVGPPHCVGFLIFWFPKVPVSSPSKNSGLSRGFPSFQALCPSFSWALPPVCSDRSLVFFLGLSTKSLSVFSPPVIID